MLDAVGRVVVLLILAGLGWIAGEIVQSVAGPSLGLTAADKPVRVPLPHHVAKYAGGLSLRLAMVHDVIHERFTRHGPAYYQHRNRVVNEELKTEAVKAGPVGGKTERYWSMLDDLGAGLGYLGKFGEATALLRDKLKQQQDAKVAGLPLYSTYANLGTFLVIDGIIRGIDSKPGAKELLQEGLGLVEQSIAVKPDAHFGREVWQAVIVEFLIAALDNPALLTRFDMVGNGLAVDVNPLEMQMHESLRRIGRASPSQLESPTPAERANLRSRIAKIRPEPDWNAALKRPADPRAPFEEDGVPFDEPVLGILGMWMLGAGANPHFAVALGEIMLRVGQRNIAWYAYERAVLTADAFLKDAKIRTAFIERCRARQSLIETTLQPDDAAQLRPRFNAELAYGQAYQKKYQQYEADRIAAGASIDDEHFYDGFFAKERRIATPPGPEEWLLIELDRHRYPGSHGTGAAHVFMIGLFVFLTGLLYRRRDNRAARQAADPPRQIAAA